MRSPRNTPATPPPAPAALPRIHYQHVELSRRLNDIWARLHTDTLWLVEQTDAAVQLAATQNDPAGRLWAHLTRALLGCAYRSQADGEADLAIAEALLPTVKMPRAERLLNVARGYMLWNREHLAEAWEHLEALPLLSQPGADDPDDFFILIGRADCALALGRIEEACHAGYRALLLAERTGPPIRRGIASMTVALALQTIDRLEEARQMLESVMHLSLITPSNRLMWLRLRVNLASLQGRCGQTSQAIESHLALLPESSNGAPGVVTAVHVNLADLLVTAGRLDEGEQHLARCYEIARGSERASWLGVCHAKAGRLAHARGRTRQAIDLFEQAIACFDRDPNGLTLDWADIDELLGRCHAEVGDYEKAYAQQARFSARQRERFRQAERGRLAAQSALQQLGPELNLSARELECLAWCAAGKTAWETGQILGLSEWTIVYHLEKTKRKLGLGTKQQLVARAISLGLVAATPTAGVRANQPQNPRPAQRAATSAK